jgi:hypothetical protein
MPVVPGAGVEHARWGGAEGIAECIFAKLIETKYCVIPGAEIHDAAEKERGIGKSFAGGLPPADALGDGLKMGGIGLLR